LTTLILAGALLLLLGGTGCELLSSRHDSRRVAPPVNPQQLYASYRFESAPDVLHFGIQPLWIPTCVIWEVMARDERMEQDLRRAGCRVQTYPFFNGRDLNEYLSSGKLQGGIAGDLPVLRIASEQEARIVSLIQQGPCSIVARQAMPMRTLRGRRIGYGPGSNAHYTLLHTLRAHGLGPKDVQLVPMDILEMPAALESGRIDAFSAWEPMPTQAMLDHPSFEILGRQEARGFVYFSRDFYARHPAAVRAIVAAEIRALRWLRTNEKNLYLGSRWAHERAVAFAGQELPSTVHDFLRLARRDLLRVPEAPRVRPDLLAPGGALHRQFRLSRAFGLLPRDADWEGVRASFVVDLVPQILRASAEYHLDDIRLRGSDGDG
jgi:ABC-type nitrate/sulfonate/bicarbonate transport system substrate-binding protein